MSVGSLGSRRGSSGVLLSTVGLEVLVNSRANGLGLDLMWCDIWLVGKLLIIPGLLERLLYT